MLDKDFGEMAIFRGLPHCGIVRLVGLSATRQASICVAVLDRYGSELKSGAIVTVTETRVRIRPRNQRDEAGATRKLLLKMAGRDLPPL